MTGITLLSTLGPCQSLSNNPSFVVNELTTVASAYTLAQFLGANAQMGASATNTTGIANAAALAANLVDPHKGTAPGAAFPANGAPPTARLNTLANLLNACATQSGASCTSVFTATSISGATPANTLDAVRNITKNPAQNVAGHLRGIAGVAGIHDRTERRARPTGRWLRRTRAAA